jgi:hypothetical protein
MIEALALVYVSNPAKGDLPRCIQRQAVFLDLDYGSDGSLIVKSKTPITVLGVRDPIKPSEHIFVELWNPKQTRFISRHGVGERVKAKPGTSLTIENIAIRISETYETSETS